MIPKHIHNLWVGGLLPDEQRAYVETWRDQNPDYEFTLWNESNIDFSIPLVKQACEERKWWHRQLVGLRSQWRMMRAACSWLRRSGDAGDLGPNLKGLGPGGSILGGRHLMTAEVEQVVDPVVGGEETLRLAG